MVRNWLFGAADSKSAALNVKHPEASYWW